MADLHILEPPITGNAAAYLESLAERARAGEFRAVAVAFIKRGRGTGSGWSDTTELAKLTGAVTALQGKLTQEMIG